MANDLRHSCTAAKRCKSAVVDSVQGVGDYKWLGFVFWEFDKRLK